MAENSDKILNGKILRDKILDELKSKIDKLPYSNRPRLEVILIGDNSSSQIYVKNKKKFAEKIGIDCNINKFYDFDNEKHVTNKIKEFNNDKRINGIIVQLPLPEKFNTEKIINSISPQKDVDGLTDVNKSLLYTGKTPYSYPCTPKGVLRLLDEYNIQIEGKHVVVIGRSYLVGKPLAQMLLNRNATVTTCHSKTENLADIIKTADILISAVGKKIVGENMIKSGCTVVDVGIFKDESGKTTGDVDIDIDNTKASFVTPTPGGVGPMTIASLMENTFELFCEQNDMSAGSL